MWLLFSFFAIAIPSFFSVSFVLHVWNCTVLDRSPSSSLSLVACPCTPSSTHPTHPPTFFFVTGGRQRSGRSRPRGEQHRRGDWDRPSAGSEDGGHHPRGPPSRHLAALAGVCCSSGSGLCNKCLDRCRSFGRSGVLFFPSSRTPAT